MGFGRDRFGGVDVRGDRIGGVALRAIAFGNGGCEGRFPVRKATPTRLAA